MTRNEINAMIASYVQAGKPIKVCPTRTALGSPQRRTHKIPELRSVAS